MPKKLIKEKKLISNFANPYKRILAFFIDILILQFIVITPFRSFFNSLLPENGNFSSYYSFMQQNPVIVDNLISIFIAISSLMIIYFVYLEYKYGQTIGKMIMKLKIISIDKKELGIFQCMARNLFLMPVFPFILLWAIDPIYLFVKGQRLSEVISKTQTIEVTADGK